MEWKYRKCGVCGDEFTANAIHEIDGVATCKWCCKVEFGPIIVYRTCHACLKDYDRALMTMTKDGWKCSGCTE